MPFYLSLVTEAFMETYLWVRYCPELVDFDVETQNLLQPKGLGSWLTRNSTKLHDKHKYHLNAGTDSH